MPSSSFFGMQHLNNNLMCAIRTDMTGPDPRIHEIIEICVLPLNQFIEPHKEILLFNLKLKPVAPELIDFKYCRLTRKEIAGAIISGIDREKVADLLYDWFEMINLPEGKRILPIGHQWPEDRQRIVDWLGYDHYLEIFSEDYRDVKVAAHLINDRCSVRGEPVTFSKQNMRWIAKQLDVEKFETGGSCIDDCRTIAESYKKQLKMLMH